MTLYTTVVFVVLLVVARISCDQVCDSNTIMGHNDSPLSRDLPLSINGTAYGSFDTDSGVQILLRPSHFNIIEGTCGYIKKWYARVNGSSSTFTGNSMIEFQIYKPVQPNSELYELVYGNNYPVNVSADTIDEIDEMVGLPSLTPNTRIPVRQDYVVGVYLPPGNAVNLLYDTSSGGNDEVYYWDSVNNRTCAFSLCTGKVLKGINLQIGWKFFGTSLNVVESTLDKLKEEDSSYCHSSDIVTICNSSSSPDTSSSSSSSSYYHEVSTSMVIPSSVLPMESSSLSSIIVPSSSYTTSTGSIPPPSSSPPSLVFGTELIAAFSIVLVLLCIVFILIIAIGVCCCMRRKPIIESSTTHGFDNPDYNGVVSSGSVKQKSIELKGVSPDPTSPVIMTTVATGSPTPQLNESHYYSTAGVQNSTDKHQLSPKTTPLSPPSISINKPRSTSDSSSLIPHSSNNDLSPLDSKSHYYSSPTTDVSNLSFPMSSGIYDTVNEDDTSPASVPPTQDPEVMYDEANVCNKTPQNQATPSDKVSSKDSIYAYVPTSEQRKLLDWRYELPLDSAYNKLKFFEEQNKFWAPASTTSGLYEQLATNKYREIPREKIRITNELGQGQFGSVSKGVWASPDGRHEVAIKMLKSNATEDDRLKLLQEAAIMGQFSNKNVVKVHGVVTLGDPIMLVLEFMPRGDLISYLRTIAPKHGRWHPPPNLPKLLLRFCRDIASGMKYLSAKSFVHRDLAARNILLSRDLTSKIGDFGMARDLMQDEGNYYTSSGGIIPIKWTAPEALNFRKYSTDSDVWSYGMVLFEIWSLGRKPFSELSNPIVIALINSKHCQAPPPGCPRPMYQLMVDCWHPEHSERPPFTKILKHLESSGDTLLGWNKENNIRGKNAHILGAPLEEANDLYIDLQRVYQQTMLLGVNGGRQRSKSNY